MANAPIGINFMPTQDAADQGQQRGNMEGDLGEAIKILSLRAPRVLGARAPTPGGNLSGGGSGALAGLAGNINTGGQAGGFNPNAALFQALNPAQTLADLTALPAQANVLDSFKPVVTATDGTVRGVPSR